MPPAVPMPLALLMALALLMPLAGCARENGDIVAEDRTPPAADSPVSRAPSEPADPAASPSGAPVPSADRPTPLSRILSPKPRIPTLPKEPTDNRPTDVIAGRITRGGTGPCYGLTTLDGIEYALHGTAAGELATGSFVTLRVAPPTSPVDCGPGIARSIVTP